MCRRASSLKPNLNLTQWHTKRVARDPSPLVPGCRLVPEKPPPPECLNVFKTFFSIVYTFVYISIPIKLYLNIQICKLAKLVCVSTAMSWHLQGFHFWNPHKCWKTQVIKSAVQCTLIPLKARGAMLCSPYCLWKALESLFSFFKSGWAMSGVNVHWGNPHWAKDADKKPQPVHVRILYTHSSRKWSQPALLWPLLLILCHNYYWKKFQMGMAKIYGTSVPNDVGMPLA